MRSAMPFHFSTLHSPSSSKPAISLSSAFSASKSVFFSSFLDMDITEEHYGFCSVEGIAAPSSACTFSHPTYCFPSVSVISDGRLIVGSNAFMLVILNFFKGLSG